MLKLKHYEKPFLDIGSLCLVKCLKGVSNQLWKIFVSTSVEEVTVLVVKILEG